MTHSPWFGPPPVPDIQRTLMFTKRQWIGMPFLFLISLLALTGLFGRHVAIGNVSDTAFNVKVMYPDRIHYRQQTTLRIAVQNVGPAIVDTITVTFDTAYMQAFTSVRAIPDMHQAYMVPLTQVASGEHRLVVIDVTGEHPGWHHGAMFVASRTHTVRFPLSTIVFP